MELDAVFLNEFIEMILELSAEAHVRRRLVDNGSPEFHKLTGAIAAYGNLLGVFTALQRVQQFLQRADDQPSREYLQMVSPQWIS